MAKASRGCVQLLFGIISSEEAIRTDITKVARRLASREQSIVQRATVVVSGLISRKLMHSLESLGVDSTAKATRSCQRRGLSLAVGTHRLGHCGRSEESRIEIGGKSSMRHELVRPDAHN